MHYPTPMHLQPAAKVYGYRLGDFSRAEAIANSVMSLPVHEFISIGQQEQVIKLIKEFYS